MNTDVVLSNIDDDGEEHHWNHILKSPPSDLIANATNNNNTTDFNILTHYNNVSDMKNNGTSQPELFTSSHSSSDRNVILFGIIFAIAFAVTAFVVILWWDAAFKSYRRQQAATATAVTTTAQISPRNGSSVRRRFRRNRYHNMTTTKVANLEKEYSRIESSLRNMYVMEHSNIICPYGDHCKQTHLSGDIESCHEQSWVQPTVGEGDSVEASCQLRISDTTSRSVETETQTVVRHNECSICLEQFQTGDIVSTSRQDSVVVSSCSCPHVFHHICLKDWLLKHNTCPACRATYFAKDDNRHRGSTNNRREEEDHGEAIVQQLPESCITDHAKFENNLNDSIIMFYCSLHGIIHHVPPTEPIDDNGATSSGSKSQVNKFLSSIVSFGSNRSIGSNIINRRIDPPSIPIPTLSILAELRIQKPVLQPSLDLSM
jgi:Ring finger domain